jgi:hypothetical protein
LTQLELKRERPVVVNMVSVVHQLKLPKNI